MKISSLVSYAYPYRGRLLLIVILSLLASAASLIIPWSAANILGSIFEQPFIGFRLAVATLVVALLALTILKIISGYITALVGTRIEADLKLDIYTHLQKLPVSFFDERRQGDLLALMTWEASQLSNFISTTLTSVPGAILAAGGAFVILLAIDPLMALAIPALVPAYFIGLKLLGRRLRTLAMRAQQAEADIFASAEEDLEMLTATKSFAREHTRRSIYEEVLEEARRLNVEEGKIYAWLDPTVHLITGLTAIAVIFFGFARVSDGDLVATELFAFLFFAALATQPLGALADLYGQFQSARGTLDRLQKVREESWEPGYTNSTMIRGTRGAIEFTNVTFSYPGRPIVVHDVNLKIESGETVAITGKNGAGKSTLVALLLSFYKPECGKITLDGINIAELNVQSLRRQIGYVPQRPLLHNATIRENITLGSTEFSESAIWKAVRAADAENFIASLPKGLDTETGDHGERLSGGQRQRIALTRAFLEDPPILILDEATSMYDMEGETALIEACQTAFKDRTVLLITHRPASLRLAERVLSIEAGRIHEVNAHSD